MCPVLEIRPTKTVPDHIRDFFHKLTAGAASRFAVLGHVHGTTNLGQEAFIKGRYEIQLDCGEARVGTVRFKRFKANARDIDGNNSVDSQEVLYETQH